MAIIPNVYFEINICRRALCMDLKYICKHITNYNDISMPQTVVFGALCGARRDSSTLHDSIYYFLFFSSVFYFEGRLDGMLFFFPGIERRN